VRKILSLTVLAIVIGLVFGATLALLTEAIDATLITLGLK
jgi:capsular polysaccharide biosynthesis protein